MVGFALGAGFVLRLLVPVGFDATVFLAFGEGSVAQTEYARQRLGDVATRPKAGHDGKYFFIQANDPWYLDPAENAVYLDRPVYRAQRMLYPLLASGLGLFSPAAIVWSLLITNVIFLGVGTFFAAKIAVRWGVSPWLGLSVPLNIGLLFEVFIGGSGLVAFVFCLAGVYALAIDRPWTAALAFAAGALSREVMLAFALGVFVLGWLERGRPVWRLVIVPAIATALWNLYLRMRLGGLRGTSDAWPLFSAPFVGIYEASRRWGVDLDLALNMAIIVIIVAFFLTGIRSRSTIVWGSLPLAAMSVVLSDFVWREPFDISRAIAPVFTAAAFLLFLPRERATFPRLRGLAP